MRYPQGSRIARYETIDELGGRTYAESYESCDTETGADAIVLTKQLVRELARTRRFEATFVRRASTRTSGCTQDPKPRAPSCGHT